LALRLTFQKLSRGLGFGQRPLRQQLLRAEGISAVPVAIRQIHPVFVGEVSGIDITRPVSHEDVAAIEAGMDKYAVLVFRNQAVSDEQQMAFTRNFGVAMSPRKKTSASSRA
jgi:alpha-ketoglutarate-dependent taurine dioxygenase